VNSDQNGTQFNLDLLMMPLMNDTAYDNGLHNDGYKKTGLPVSPGNCMPVHGVIPGQLHKAPRSPARSDHFLKR